MTHVAVQVELQLEKKNAQAVFVCLFVCLFKVTGVPKYSDTDTSTGMCLNSFPEKHVLPPLFSRMLALLHVDPAADRYVASFQA